MSTNVPSIVFTPTGVTVPQESAVLAGVQADMAAAFATSGQTLNPALNTPQGQWASSQAAIVSDADAIFAYFVSQVDPDTAADFMQDAIGRIYFMEREPGTATQVVVECTGGFNTVIPQGAKIQSASGNFYICTLGGTIPVGGTISLPFSCVTLGPVACPAHDLSTANGAKIITGGINGWDSIDNPLAGAVGSDVESRAAFEFRRQQSVALNAHGSIVAIKAAVFDVPGVIDVLALENISNATITGPIGGQPNPTAYPLVAHSIYVAVTGGDPTAIANAIFSKKNDGSNMNGNTTVTIVDDSYDAPQPSYTYTFEIPPTLAFKVAVQIQNSASLPADIVTQVQTAVVNSFNGIDGSRRVRTGGLALAGKFYAPVSAIGPEVNVVQILLGTTTATLTSFQVGIDQFPTLQASDVSVTLV